MKNIFGIIVIIVVMIALIWFYISIADFSPKNKDDLLLEKINELELKIDSLSNKKDSIRSVIDSTHIKIVTNEKHYQERINTIITKPDTFSESFTRQYIREYAASHGYHLLGTSETK